MMFYDFQVENTTYKLRLNTRNTIMLEKALGCNPLAIFGNGETIPTVTTMVNVLFAAMQQYNHGISLNDAYDIYDKWINEGHTVTDFIPIILEVYKVSGIIKADAEVSAEKN